MMNEYHWDRPDLEACFPVGAKVLYCGHTNPKLVGLNGVVTGYSQSGGIKVHFDNCHAITHPKNLAVVPEETPKVAAVKPEIEPPEQAIRENFPVDSIVRYVGVDNKKFTGESGFVTGYTPYGDVAVRFGAVRAYVKPSSLHMVCKATPPTVKPEIKVKSDVTHPNHYMLLDNVEAIEIIARSMTVEAFRGFCLGNVLKYHLRAGKKAELATMEKDLKKAAFYQELFDKHKGMCHDAT